MLIEDSKRLQRERDLAEAVRGPDYRQHDDSVRKVKAEISRRDTAAIEAHARERSGYYQSNPPRDEFGSPLPFRPGPAHRVR